MHLMTLLVFVLLHINISVSTLLPFEIMENIVHLAGPSEILIYLLLAFNCMKDCDPTLRPILRRNIR